nr:immunoglobulin light chain junction region [Macaca mulatta]MOX33344.1 immunoglobulin light chain junction region [Macaca mulatta]MOX33378.1 immunoglobulin light chain junction region [Macaca mulatta]MOX33471.1 immunoglobulin light chain junction region [Macaca mulatta]MOX33491.1 immunoglobulin light chain junction region [Macaca mulatta]
DYYCGSYRSGSTCLF